MRSVNYIVTYGVTSRHLHESAGVFNKLKDAKQAYESVKLEGGFNAKRLVRLSYPNKWEGANDIRIIIEVLY